jgi:hypothetical protein
MLPPMVRLVFLKRLYKVTICTLIALASFATLAAASELYDVITKH